MTRRAIVIAAVLGGACSSARLDAQVGHEPQRSPYNDLRETQELTFFSGYYRAKKDPARTVPQSGPMAGVMYQWRPGGPAHLNLTLTRVASERRVLDPELPKTCSGPPTDCKVNGVYRWPLYAADAGVALALTGARSFYRLVPEIKGGAGIVTDFHTQPDIGDFAFGTRFAFTWGAGIRWVPGGRYQLRADLTNHLYSVRYPVSYYQFAPDTSAIFTQRQSRTAWLNNPGFTIGVSYLFSR
jgi:hypothetical protein